MRLWRSGLVVVGILGAGALVYGWGQGLFFPCGSIDRYLRMSNCAVIARWDDTMVEALVGADGALLVANRAVDKTSGKPQVFIDLALDGTQSQPRALADIAPDAPWLDAEISPDGKSVLASILEDGLVLLDRETGNQLASYEGNYGTDRFAFAANGDVLVGDRRGIGFDGPIEPIALRYAPDGRAQGNAATAEAWPVFTSGIGAATTADGALMVQHESTLKETQTVALRVVEPALSAYAGQLMLAPIGGYLDQVFPRISVRSDGKYVAASFDSADGWGQIRSALVIWDLETRKLITMVPTWRAGWENMVWLADGRLAASRYNIDWLDSEVVVISYEK